jgi:hypothetical protein
MLGNFHELRKFGMSDQRSGLVEDHDGAVRARPLGLHEMAEGVELEVGGNHAGDLAPQRRADRDHGRADAEGEIGRRDVRTVRPHGLPVPGAVAGVVSVLPQIDFTDVVALPVLENPSHRQLARGRWANQIYHHFGMRRRT